MCNTSRDIIRYFSTLDSEDPVVIVIDNVILNLTIRKNGALNIKELNCQACLIQRTNRMIGTLQAKLKCRTIRFNLSLKFYPLCSHH